VTDWPGDGFYKTIIDHLYDGVYFVDNDRVITYWNKGAERITGFTAEQVVGKSCRDHLLVHVNDRGTLLCHAACPLAHAMESSRSPEAEIYLRHARGHRVPVLVRSTPIHDEAGRIIGAVEVFSDNSRILEARHELAELQAAAFQDALTGVGNRRLLEQKITDRLRAFQRGGSSLGLLFLDVDDFKSLNDRFGHAAGDRVLKMVADTIRHNVRASDVCGRWGGDEFTVIASGVDESHLLALAEKMRALVASSILAADDERIQVTISAGAAMAHPNDTPDELMQRADKMLYESKTTGRNRVTGAGDDIQPAGGAG